MKLHHNGDRIRLKTRQETTQLVSGDEFFGDGGWQCVADGCSNPITTDSSMATCDGNCLHFNLPGGSNTQVGAQRTIAAAPLINGGGSFTISFRAVVFWISTGTTVAVPSANVHLLANVAGTSMTFAIAASNTQYSSLSWQPWQYQGFISDSSSSTATITLGFNAQVATGTGYYSIWIDQFSLTVPKSSSAQETSATSSIASLSTTVSLSPPLASAQETTSNGTRITNPTQVTSIGSASDSSFSLVSSSQSNSLGGTVSNTDVGRSGGTDQGAPSTGLIGGVVAAVLVVVISIMLALWLLKRSRRRGWKRSGAGLVNPFRKDEDYDSGIDNNHQQHSPSAITPASVDSVAHVRPVEMTEQEQLRQWMTSPTEMLPAYRTSLGSAIPGPVEESEYDEEPTPQPQPFGLVLHGPIPEEANERAGSTSNEKGGRNAFRPDMKR